MKLHILTNIISISTATAWCFFSASLTADTPKESVASQPDLATIMAFLKPETTVLTVGTQSLTWGEFKPVILSLTRSKSNTSTSEMTARTREKLQSIAARAMLLQEANNLKITVSDSEQADFEKELEENLKDNKFGITKKQYLARFKRKTSTMTDLAYKDTLRLIKLDKIKFGNIPVSPQMLKLGIQYVTLINKQIEDHNQTRRLACQSIMKEKSFSTDEGFARFAREYSEGVEAKRGGELNYNFTREQLAEVCGIPSFDFKVGENTPLYETKNSLRIMRVLREIPQQEAKQPKLRMAQILIGKIEMQNSNPAHLKATIQKGLKKTAFERYIKLLRGKYPVKTLFFPNGLWDDSTQKNARAKQR